jgi:hypothetical protein
LLLGTGYPDAFEPTLEPDVDVKVPGILVEVKECPAFHGEVAALTFSQLGELAQLYQDRLEPVKVFLGGVPHGPMMATKAGDAPVSTRQARVLPYGTVRERAHISSPWERVLRAPGSRWAPPGLSSKTSCVSHPAGLPHLFGDREPLVPRG